MIDSSSASDQKSCHGLGFESERESSVQSRQRCHWSLASSLMAYRPQNADRRTEKMSRIFTLVIPERCHTNKERPATFTRHQIGVDFVQRCHRTRRPVTLSEPRAFPKDVTDVSMQERLALQVPECQGRRRCHGDDLRRAQGSASARLHQSVSGGRRQRLQPSYAGASNVNRVLDQRRVLGRERKTQQPT